MSEEFDFAQKERREARNFEPPPWEKDAFEKLERQRAEVQAAQEAKSEPTPPETPTKATQDTAAAPSADAGLEWLEVAQEQAGATQQVATEKPARSKGAVDEAKVAYMLAELAAQEPDTRRSLGTIALWSAAGLASAGLVFVVWGVVALAGSATTGRIGTIGGSTFLFLGGAAVGAAIWLVVRTLRQRGVL